MASFSDPIWESLRRAARSAAPPPADLDIVRWNEENRILGRSSRLGGRIRFAQTPYWREPARLLSPQSPIQQVVIRKASQMGATELALSTIAYYVAVAPSPILVAQPTILMATRFSRQRLAEAIALTPALRDLMATPRGGERSNSALMKSARNGALLLLAGTNAPSMLRSLPIRVLVLDEVDAYPHSSGQEGDPVELSSQRTESYQSQKKILCISTPTIKGESHIDNLYQASDRRLYFVQCPSCGNWITLEFGQLYLEADAAFHRCQICGAAILEGEKMAMLERGDWRATAQSADPLTAGFHINQVASPWSSWAGLLARHRAAEGIPEKQQVFMNCCLAECWSPPALAVPEAETLAARCEAFPAEVPQPVALLTCGMDLQADRAEIEVVGWSRGFESWSIRYDTIYGDPLSPQLWQQIDALLSREFRHQSGMPLAISASCVDAGYLPDEVLSFTKSRFGRRIYGVKGLAQGFTKPIWPRRPIYNRKQLPLFLISSDEAKLWFHNRLRIAEPGPGYCHYPVGRPLDYFRMPTAERLVTRYRGGRAHQEWTNLNRERNEALDARTYAIAALFSLLMQGLNLDQHCEDFERMLKPAPVNGPPAVPTHVVRSKFVHG